MSRSLTHLKIYFYFICVKKYNLIIIDTGMLLFSCLVQFHGSPTSTGDNIVRTVCDTQIFLMPAQVRNDCCFCCETRGTPSIVCRQYIIVGLEHVCV